jgi:hypothetical protein
VHGAAEVHEDDDPAAGVRVDNGVGDADGVRAEGTLVEARCLLDPHGIPVQHLTREGDRGPGQGAAVGDDHETDETAARRGHASPVRSTCAAAARRSAAEVAPGSWCPTLRSPR